VNINNLTKLNPAYNTNYPSIAAGVVCERISPHFIHCNLTGQLYASATACSL